MVGKKGRKKRRKKRPQKRFGGSLGRGKEEKREKKKGREAQPRPCDLGHFSAPFLSPTTLAV